MKYSILAIIVLFATVSCQTNTGDPKKDQQGRVANAVLQEVFNSALQIGLSAGEGAVNGYAEQHGASAIFANPSAVTIDGSAAIQRIITAAAGPASTPLAAQSAALFAKANPSTSADKVQVANTIGAGLQAAAAQVIYNQGQP